MDKYIFILGRNWRLALAEVDLVLQLPEYMGQITDYSANTAIVEFEKDQSLEQIGDLMIRLGSVQKIGKMIDFMDKETFEKAFPIDIEANRAGVFSGRKYLDDTLNDLIYELFPNIEGEKFFVANSIYPEEFSDEYYQILIKYGLHYLNKFFNVRLKEQGAKNAIYYRYPQKNIDSGHLNPIFPHHFFKYELYLPNRVELLYCLTEEGTYIGKTLTVSDSNFQKEMDEERPYKDHRQSIPPKFAKTLISLLGISSPLKNHKVYDPFCGAGTILQFAHMLSIDFFGSDIDPAKVDASRANVKYTGQLMEQPLSDKTLEKKIFQCDIAEINTKFKPNSLDGIITEPVLLPYYRVSPSYQDTMKKIEEIKSRYEFLLKHSYELLKPGARLCVVAPIVITDNKQRVKLPLELMAKKEGFTPIRLLNEDRFVEKERPKFKISLHRYKSILDTGSKRVIREFFLFQKPAHRRQRN